MHIIVVILMVLGRLLFAGAAVTLRGAALRPRDPVFLVWAAVSLLAAEAPSDSTAVRTLPPPPFAVGEKLVFSIDYGMINAGEGVLEVGRLGHRHHVVDALGLDRLGEVRLGIRSLGRAQHVLQVHIAEGCARTIHNDVTREAVLRDGALDLVGVDVAATADAVAMWAALQEFGEV